MLGLQFWSSPAALVFKWKSSDKNQYHLHNYNECDPQPFLGWPQASIIGLRPICKYWFLLQIICSRFIWNLKVLQFCSLCLFWYQRYSYKLKDLPIDTSDSYVCQVMKMRCFRVFLSFLRNMVLRKLQLSESTALEAQQTLFTRRSGKKKVEPSYANVWHLEMSYSCIYI